MAITVFPGESYQARRSWAERAYPQLIYYNRVDRGGHFAARTTHSQQNPTVLRLVVFDCGYQASREFVGA